MKVWVVGANGQLGRELTRQLKNNLHQVITVEHKNVDITCFNKVNEFALHNKPDIIINCAAYTDVEKCEEDIFMAYKVNAIGVRNLAIVSNIISAKLIQISTDYVFDGESLTPRFEKDMTNPKSIYGLSKLVGEMYTQIYCKKYFIIRTAWLYGEGNNFVRTILGMAQKRDKINVVGDQIGTPTPTKDLAAVIIKLMQTDFYGIFHATSEGQCSWYEFACEIVKLAKLNVKINKITTKQYNSKVKRPKYSVLENHMLKKYKMNIFEPWQISLEKYLCNK